MNFEVAMHSDRDHLGGIIHTYQKYDPAEFPSPTAEPPDLVSPAFEHLLMYGNIRELTEEELARAVRFDPSQIKNLGPSIEALMEMLRERKRRILETYETETVQNEARVNYENQAHDSKKRFARNSFATSKTFGTRLEMNAAHSPRT
jgi:hypothetical protein